MSNMRAVPSVPYHSHYHAFCFRTSMSMAYVREGLAFLDVLSTFYIAALYSTKLTVLLTYEFISSLLIHAQQYYHNAVRRIELR